MRSRSGWGCLHPATSPVGLVAALALWLAACGSEAPAPNAADAGADSTASDGTDTAPDTSDSADSQDPDASADASDSADAATDLDWPARFAKVIPPLGVLDLRLTLKAGDWTQLLADWTEKGQKVEYPVQLQWGKDALTGAGVRLKGLSSLTLPVGGGLADPAAKYPLKIDFNAFGGERYYGVDEAGLNSAVHDASYMREWLTAALYGALQVDVAHLGYANVHVDTHHAGLYVLSQSIDKQFLKERFGEANGADDGNLYKCVYNGFGACSMAYLGDQPQDYQKTTNCGEGYDACGMVLQTNEDDPAKNDYADLIALTKVVSQTPDSAFEAEISKVFDVEHFLRLAAVAAATGNYDSYFGKGNNFYLYHRNDGRFQMIPWDFDLTYGGGCESDLADPTCGGLQSHPLAGRILAVPKWRAKYLEHTCTLAQQWMTAANHKGWIAALDGRIGSFARTDPNAPDGASYDDQIKDDPDGAQYGNLLAFVRAREQFLLGACALK